MSGFVQTSEWHIFDLLALVLSGGPL